ncbi:MAG TPA: amidohydrolase family protein [Thermoanaerobaculia bacterium]|nr:amidohydrolase family protein [Thermoanaerobaculia bacterium]
MLLVEHADVFAPAPLGKQSILIAGGRIETFGADGRALAQAGVEVEVLDGSGCIAVPGLIDPHVHSIGGSGESGFATQTPELFASELLAAGITTVVGTLGTDTTTRTMAALLAKTKALREEGLSAYAWTGGYDARALTGSVRDDIVLLEEVIGAGELAIADKRGRHYDARDLARLANDCYVAGTLTGKAGVLHLHVGDGASRLALLREVLDDFEVPAATLYPTHVERNEALMSEAIALTKRGVPIDVDVYEEDLVKWLRFYIDGGGDPSMLTVSTDAAINAPRTLLEQLVLCIREEILPLEQTLALATRNTARVLKLRDAGELAPGRVASLLLLDAQSYELRHVICNGRVVRAHREKWIEKSNRVIRLGEN